MSNTWNPDTYEQFADLRSQPFHDLIDMVGPVPVHSRIVDLGCGTGALTASLAHRFLAEEVLGIDSSAEMLERSEVQRYPAVRFEPGDIGTFERPRSFDLVVSNAALHWTDDHRTTLTLWANSLRPGGQLAVQLSANFAHPSHTVADTVANDPHFDTRWTTGARPASRGDHVLAPGEYAEILFDLGFAEQSVSLKVYPMVLPSSSTVFDWVRGTLLVPFRSSLGAEDYAEFERRYETALATEIGGPTGAHQPYFYGFERILMWGRRAP